MDLRPSSAHTDSEAEPKEENYEEKRDGEREVQNTQSQRIKTSITLDRHLAVQARAYVSAQQLRYARGERSRNYSFSQLFNDALSQYLKGETDETGG